jgi:hypothetical protein
MRRALLVALLGVATSTSAWAQSIDERACQRVRHEGLVDGPVAIGLYDADIGVGRSACLHGELTLGERLGATYDLRGFYGGVRADTLVTGSYRLRKNLALIGALEMVHWEFAQNGPIKATAIGLGQLTMGLQGLALETRRFALSVYGHVLVPTATDSVSVQTTGAEVGVAALFRPRRDLEVHGQLSGDFSVGLSSGPAGWRGGTALSLGLQFAPAGWFAFSVDLQATLGHRAALDALLPLVALRFRAWRGLGIELDATAPVAGADRRLALGVLRLSYRF